MTVMSKAQNTQLHLISPIVKTSKLLKFCYFMVALVLMSCGNSNPIKINNESVTVTPIENEVAATS